MSSFLQMIFPKGDILFTTPREKCVCIKPDSYFNRNGRHVTFFFFLCGHSLTEQCN